MVSKTQKVPIYNFFIVVGGSKISRWQLEMLQEIETSQMAVCSLVLRLDNTKNSLSEDKYLNAIRDKYIINRSGCLKEIDFESSSLTNSPAEKLITSKNLSNDETFLDVKDADFIINLTEEDISLRSIKTKLGTWSFPFSSDVHRGVTELYIDANLKKEDYIACNVTSKIDQHEGIIELDHLEYSCAYMSMDLISDISKDLIKSTLKVLSNFSKLESHDLTTFKSVKSPTHTKMNCLKYINFKYRHLYKYLVKLCYSEFFEETWSVGLKKADFESIFKKSYIENLNWHDLKKDYKFVADPFIKRVDGQLYLMAEAIGEETDKGLIVSYEVNETTLELSGPTTVFQTDGHLSYPYLIEEKGELYCLPESGDSGELCLYKSIEFPYKWEKVSVLIKEKHVLDASVIKYNEKWWLFCTEFDDGPLSKLRLWYSDELEKGWREHTSSPVANSIRYGRPAGNLFIKNGKLYRPAQNAQKSYGGALSIMEVTQLSESNYQEKLLHVIYPEKSCSFSDGIHTLSIEEDIIVVDGKKLTFSFKKFLIWFRGKIGIH